MHMAYLDPVNTLVAISAGAVLLGGTFYVLFGSPFDRKLDGTRKMVKVL